MNEEINSILVDVWFRRLDTTVATRKLEAINLAQTEAHVSARVKQALEEAADIADQHNAFSVYDAILALIPE